MPWIWEITMGHCTNHCVSLRMLRWSWREECGVVLIQLHGSCKWLASVLTLDEICVHVPDDQGQHKYLKCNTIQLQSCILQGRLTGHFVKCLSFLGAHAILFNRPPGTSSMKHELWALSNVVSICIQQFLLDSPLLQLHSLYTQPLHTSAPLGSGWKWDASWRAPLSQEIGSVSINNSTRQKAVVI